MLPNFRKSEPEAARGQPNLPANDQPSAFPARPFVAGQRANERAGLSVIGPDLIINGNLISKGEVQVDGIVEGDIHGSHVIVGPNANIKGGIVAEEIVIRGHVTGTVRGKRVMLQASSEVDGDIYHNALSIEQGAMFEGKSRRTTQDPREGATISELPRPAQTAHTGPVLAAVSPSTPSYEQQDESEASVTIVPPRLPGAR
ncbi:MAG: polymer-forming cytoskeletal protein [Hyphomicrobium sp.]|nr:polymer-forming cytoskeletal protein [Hyphomicrobiaceae bacterium]